MSPRPRVRNWLKRAHGLGCNSQRASVGDAYCETHELWHRPPMNTTEALAWLISQEGVVMSDTRASKILGWAMDAGMAPANSEDWLQYAPNEGYTIFHDPIGVKRFTSQFRGLDA